MIKKAPINKPGPHYWLGSFIRERRMVLGITQQELSAAVGYVSLSALGKVESGRTTVPAARIPVLCQALRLDPVIYVARATEDFREVLVNKLGGRL